MVQFIKDFGAFIAALVSPIIAIGLTIWYQNRQARRTAKMNLFNDLVSFRNYIPLPWQYTVALNRIDIVFHKQAKIRQLWHEYYDLIELEQIEPTLGKVKEKKIALISEMAKHLGYKNIDQIFLQRYYQTQGHFDQFVSDVEIRKEMVRVLKSTETLYILGKYPEDSYSKDIADGTIKGVKLSEQDPLK
ncbi:MAG TPA: DUF6680 family protein [Chitinophagaceae bacterium]|nr:DUF6680 family protein [Chitinophagaceae bacterium]